MKTNPYIDRHAYRARLREMGYHHPHPFPIRYQAALSAFLTITLLTFSLTTTGTTSWVLLALTIAAASWCLATAGVALHNRKDTR